MCTDSLRESLVGFLYGELTPEEQRTFEAHLKTCAGCRTDVAELRSVRDDLLAWAPPECRELPSSWTAGVAVAPAAMDRLRAWAPAFGLAAAAMLVLAVSAAIANLEVRYDEQGLVVRTGRAAAAPPAAEAAGLARAEAQAQPAQAVTADDLAALEARVLQNFAAPATRAGMQTVALTSNNPQLTREVRRLIEESERRTQQEMAQRFLDIVSELETNRRTDMLRVQQVLGQMQSRTGVELAQTKDAIGRLMLASQQGQAPR